MSIIPEPSSDGKRQIHARELHKHCLLSRAASKDFHAFAYPISEAEGIYFWSKLLPRFGLEYLCSPGRNRAPDEYWGVTSKLTEPNRRLIRKSLRSGAFAQSLFDEGVVLGIEFESKASNAKSHFEKDGAEHISLVCCNVNDCKTLPVQVLCLRDYLEVQRPRRSTPVVVPEPTTVAHSPEPVAFDERNYHEMSSSLESVAQRLVLLAFLAPESQQISTGERRLYVGVIKTRANQIAVLNGYEGVKVTGGGLTGFTQPGLKKDLGLLRKGEKAGERGCRGRNYYLAARFYSCLGKLAEDANLHLPGEWNV